MNVFVFIITFPPQSHQTQNIYFKKIVAETEYRAFLYRLRTQQITLGEGSSRARACEQRRADDGFAALR